MTKVHWPPMNKFACKLHGYIVYFNFRNPWLCDYVTNVCKLIAGKFILNYVRYIIKTWYRRKRKKADVQHILDAKIVIGMKPCSESGDLYDIMVCFDPLSVPEGMSLVETYIGLVCFSR